MDLLVFPDCIRYLGLSAADIPIFVADHLVANHLTGNTASRRLAALRNTDRLAVVTYSSVRTVNVTTAAASAAHH